MADVKVTKSRIILKHDIKSNWDKAENFIPLEGEIIIYDANEDTNNKTKIKIGDGIQRVFDLPYYGEEAISDAEIARICGMHIENGEVTEL